MTDLDMMCFLPEASPSEINRILADWKNRFPDMGVLALLPEDEKDSCPKLQELCNGKGIPLVGGIFPELIHNEKFSRRGMWLLCFPEMPLSILSENLPADEANVEKISSELASRVSEQLKEDTNYTLFMFFDSMVPNIGTILDKLYLRLANRVHYTGGNAGSETFKPMPCLFDNQRIVHNGVLMLLLEKHHGAILEHGYHAPQDVVYATSVEGNRISQIDWRPAFEVYQELVHRHYDTEITPENFYQYAVHFPFGIVRANHHVVVRIPVMLAEDGSLFCVGEVPPNAVLTLLAAPEINSTETMDVLAKGLSTLNGGPTGEELLLFYCAGRRMHLGPEAAASELGMLNQRTGAKVTAGALSLGEIGASTVHGYPLFHNAALAASLWK